MSDRIMGAVHEPRQHDSGHKHVTGQAVYIDDLPEPAGLLHGYFGVSAESHARITKFDLEPVRAAGGVVLVIAAFNLRIDEDRVAEARVAFGGMAETPKRARAVEARLTGSAWTEATVRSAMAELEKDFTPIADMRASAGYRLRVAQNLLMRLFVETTDSTQETRLVGDRRLAHV